MNVISWVTCTVLVLATVSIGMSFQPSGPISSSAPTGDAINQREISIPMGLVEKLHFAQFANGGGLVSQVGLLPAGYGEAVRARLKLSDGEGASLKVALNGEMVSGETEIFRIPTRGDTVFTCDGEGPVAAGSVTVSSDRPLTGVVLFEGGAVNLGVAGVGSSEPMPAFRAAVESRIGDAAVRTGVAVMNPDAEEKTFQVRLLDLEGTVPGTGAVTADPLAAYGHVARFLDEFHWDDPVSDLTDFPGVLEVMPSGGQVAATVLRLSPGSLASLPVVPQ